MNIMWKHQKTMSNISYSSFNMGEMDKSRVLYSRMGDNSSADLKEKVACPTDKLYPFGFAPW